MSLRTFLFPPSTTPAEAATGDVVILDVRERGEWKAGHAPRSKNIPLSTLPKRTGELRVDRRYAVVCRSGSRSRSAVGKLRAAGLDVVNVSGGMHAWVRAGLPLEPRGGRIV